MDIKECTSFQKVHSNVIHHPWAGNGRLCKYQWQHKTPSRIINDSRKKDSRYYFINHTSTVHLKDYFNDTLKTHS